MKTKLMALFLIFPFLINAEDKKKIEAIDTSKLKHPVKPALWKVEGKDLTKPSYLFGTIHLGDPRVVKLHPKAEKTAKRAMNARFNHHHFQPDNHNPARKRRSRSLRCSRR